MVRPGNKHPQIRNSHLCPVRSNLLLDRRGGAEAEYKEKMGKQYYYLGADRIAPKGPHTPEELGGMLLRGELLPTTEVAAEGDAQWQPLGKLLMSDTIKSPLPTQAAHTLPATEASTGGDLPPVPGFTAGTIVSLPPALPPATATPGMWSCVRLSISRTFCWRGRARRAEFWYSWLFYLLVTFVLVMSCIFCLSVAIAGGALHIEPEELSLSTLLHTEALLPFWVASACYILWTLWMSVAFLTLTARRLHDTGRSGLWVIFSILSGLSWQAHYFQRVAEIIGSVNWKLVLAIQDKASRDARIGEITQQINLAGYDGWWSLLYLLNLALGIFILIFALTDSTPGENKYGASPKYPQQ